MIAGDLKFDFEVSAPESFGTIVRDQQSIDEAIERILNSFDNKSSITSEIPQIVYDSITEKDPSGIYYSEDEKNTIKDFFSYISDFTESEYAITFAFNDSINFYFLDNDVKENYLKPQYLVVGRKSYNYEAWRFAEFIVDGKEYMYPIVNRIIENNGAIEIEPEINLSQAYGWSLSTIFKRIKQYNEAKKQKNSFNINTSGNNLLILHANKNNNNEKTDTIGNTAAEYLNNIADMTEKAKGATNPNDQKIKDVESDLNDATENKLKEFLNNAGLSENPTDEEIQEAAEVAANKLADAIQNGALNNNSKTGNELADTILDGLRDNDMNGSGGGNGKNPIGLRYDIYNAMTLIGKIPDPTMVLFPAAISTVIANYFMYGTLIITVHLGGTAIIGVGTKLLSLALPGLPKAIITLGNNVPGMPGYQSGLCSNSYPNYIDQGKAWSNAISGDLYQTGSTITELVIGTMVGSPSPIPFVGTGMKQQLTTTVLKVLVLVASMASYIVMQAAGIAAQLTGKQETLENIIGIPKMFKDLNDFFAAMMAVAVKAGLLLTLTKTLCTTTASTGTGLIIPIAP